MNSTRARVRLPALVWLAPLLLGACAPYVRTQYTHPGFSVKDVPAAGASVLATRQASLSGFGQSFKALYGDPTGSDSLSNHLAQAIADSLGASSVAIPAAAANDRYVGVLRANSLDSSEVAATSEFLKGITTRYLVVVRKVDVVSKSTYNAANGTSTTECVVTLSVEVWDPLSRQKMTAFEVDAASSVFLFAFQTALKSAVRKAAGRTVSYLKTGNKGP